MLLLLPARQAEGLVFPLRSHEVQCGATARLKPTGQGRMATPHTHADSKDGGCDGGAAFARSRLSPTARPESCCMCVCRYKIYYYLRPVKH